MEGLSSTGLPRLVLVLMVDDYVFPLCMDVVEVMVVRMQCCQVGPLYQTLV